MRVARFTNVVLCGCCVSAFMGTHSMVWAVTTCWIWGVLVSFTCARAVDRTAYVRMARSNGWSMPLFHAGNIVLHVLPALATMWWPPARMGGVDALCAAVSHGMWFAAMGGTSGMSRMYVPLTHSQWYALTLSMWSAMAAASVMLPR